MKLPAFAAPTPAARQPQLSIDIWRSAANRLAAVAAAG